jgi:BolA family transcriptional regulator, general stress-responsive regulator
MPVADNIERKLAAGLAPLRLTVTDQSHLHAGHAGARPGGESHFRVEIVAAKFRGMNRLARQREVHRILAEELAGPVHALSIAAQTPEEADAG